MEIIEPKVELLKQAPGLQGIFAAIARAGRICYASNQKGKDEDFVKRLIDSSHYRPLEFGTVYLTIPMSDTDYEKYLTNPYSKVNLKEGNAYVTTNYRVIVEHNWEPDLRYLTEPCKFHNKRFTFHWTIARSIADEMRTHVSLSSLMESTRYCGYMKERFGHHLTFIKPSDWQNNPSVDRLIKWAWKVSEIAYKWLIWLGAKPQQARRVLPLDIKTEFIQCGFADAWDHFFDLRYYGVTGAPHPDCKYITTVACDLFYGEKNKI